LKKWSKTDKRGVQRALELPFFRGVLAKQEAKIAFIHEVSVILMEKASKIAFRKSEQNRF
jgi:hypothetical protein